MFSEQKITGKYLAPKTLCLTFDDGPGAETPQIAEFLFKQGISATFFVSGIFAKQYPEMLATLVKTKHVIANHTYNHPRLPKFFKEGGDVLSEITLTEDQIADYINGDTIYFRPPYNDWLPEIASTLNSTLKSKFKYLGPFHGEIDGSDWAYWEKGAGPEECAESYMNEIRKSGNGIILMHDSCADNEVIKRNNRTYETIKIIIPQLKKEGYKFVGLDEVVRVVNSPAARYMYSVKSLIKKVKNKIK